MQPAGRIDDDDVHAARLGRVHGVEDHGRGIGARRVRDDRHVDTRGPGGDLFDGGSAEGVGSGQQDLGAKRLEAVRQLGDGGGLARAVDADDEDDCRDTRPGDTWPGHGLALGEEVQQLQLQRLLGSHVGSGAGAVTHLDGELGAEVGRDERLLDLLPGLVVGTTCTEQAPDTLREAVTRRLQGVLQQDALGWRRIAFGRGHTRAPPTRRTSSSGRSASLREMTRLTASSPTVTP